MFWHSAYVCFRWDIAFCGTFCGPASVADGNPGFCTLYIKL